MRLARNAPASKVNDLLTVAWQIPKSQLILSIIGGAKFFSLTDRLESNLINGIVSVALEAGRTFSPRLALRIHS